jgi:formamidopyrimidine-DNA glycosylase
VPELPELEVVRDVLQDRLAGRHIQEVTIAPRGGPIVVRDLTGRGFRQGLVGEQVETVERHGKFMVFRFQAADLMLVANPKLTGRFQLSDPGGKKAGAVHVTLHFGDPDEQLRYIDQKRMGQLYLTDQLDRVPTFPEMGPDALSVSREEFRQRLRRFRGEIKGVLARERFLAGIGNAYADEILWQAQIHPYRKRTELAEDEIDRLYDGMRETLLSSIDKVREAMGEDIHLKPREFFAVHMRGGEQCPRCSGSVSEITARGRITNFCRSCQPGGLIRGM